MGDFGVVIALGVLYAILSVLGRFAKRGEAPSPTAPPRQRVPGQPQTLEDLLAEMRGQIEQEQPVELLPPEPEVVPPRLPARVTGREVINYDDRAAAVVAGRITEAAARDGALNAADHARFDRKIRAVEPEVVVDTRRRDALRKAVVWSEILGKPVALRDEDP
ncbi:MAG TPA: hypothetical protein VFN22_08850 [Gemmatimonadales bacterium]|nr:hypothetical protein [Gemmatimonadales bacterium]